MNINQLLSAKYQISYRAQKSQNKNYSVRKILLFIYILSGCKSIKLYKTRKQFHSSNKKFIFTPYRNICKFGQNYKIMMITK